MFSPAVKAKAKRLFESMMSPNCKVDPRAILCSSKDAYKVANNASYAEHLASMDSHQPTSRSEYKTEQSCKALPRTVM